MCETKKSIAPFKKLTKPEELSNTLSLLQVFEDIYN